MTIESGMLSDPPRFYASNGGGASHSESKLEGVVQGLEKRFDDLRHDLDLRFARADTNDTLIRTDVSHSFDEREKNFQTYINVTGQRLIVIQDRLNETVSRNEWSAAHQVLMNQVNDNKSDYTEKIQDLRDNLTTLWSTRFGQQQTSSETKFDSMEQGLNRRFTPLERFEAA